MRISFLPPHIPTPPTPSWKKKGIKNRRLKLKRLWRKQKQTKPINQQKCPTHRQNQNNLKEGKYISFAQTNISTFHYCTLSWTTELNHSFSVQMWTLKWYWLIQDSLIVLIFSPNWFKWKPACPRPSTKQLRNTIMKEVGKDWELTKIAHSISNNQGSTKSGEGLGDGCHGNLCSLVTLRPWPSKVTAWKLRKCTQLSKYIFKMQKWTKVPVYVKVTRALLLQATVKIQNAEEHITGHEWQH